MFFSPARPMSPLRYGGCNSCALPAPVSYSTPVTASVIRRSCAPCNVTPVTACAPRAISCAPISLPSYNPCPAPQPVYTPPPCPAPVYTPPPCPAPVYNPPPCPAPVYTPPPCPAPCAPCASTSSYVSSYVPPPCPPPPAPVCPPPVPACQDVSVMTNVPPIGSTSVTVVDCGPSHFMPPPPPPQAFQPTPSFQPTQSFTQTSSQTQIIRRELPGADSIKAEFRDLREMLDRDRSQFELSRQEFERSIAERELKLKMEQERISGEWTRFEAAKAAIPPPPPPRPVSPPRPTIPRDAIVVKNLKEAQEMDVKDGIIDGMFNGRPIYIEGQGPLVPPPHLMGKRIGGGKGTVQKPATVTSGENATRSGGGAANVVLPAGAAPKFTLGQQPKLPPPNMSGSPNRTASGR